MAGFYSTHTYVLATALCLATSLPAMAALQVQPAASNIDSILHSAEQGNAEDENELGLMYHKGDGVTQNDAEAAKWFRKAAEQNDANAQNNLADMYANGIGVTQNYSEAAKLYRKAAEQNNDEAAFSLSLLYFKGQGVNKDPSESAKWLFAAAKDGNAKAKELIRFSGKLQTSEAREYLLKSIAEEDQEIKNISAKKAVVEMKLLRTLITLDFFITFVILSGIFILYKRDHKNTSFLGALLNRIYEGRKK